MASLAQEAATVGFVAQQPWPNDVCLYQPYEVGQALMTDFSSMLSVKTFLRMCGLPYREVLKTNAEFMSPSGKVPFIKAGPMLVSELEPIISFVQTKGHNLSEDLDENQKADMKAYMSMVDQTFTHAQMYLYWQEAGMKEVTTLRYGSPYTWPLCKLLPIKKRWQMQSYLKAAGWNEKTWDQVCDEVKTCCQALSEKLGEQNFFFGEKPTELDAVVFGHLFSMTTTEIPVRSLAVIVNSFDNLSAFSQRVNSMFFGENLLESES